MNNLFTPDKESIKDFFNYINDRIKSINSIIFCSKFQKKSKMIVYTTSNYFLKVLSNYF